MVALDDLLAVVIGAATVVSEEHCCSVVLIHTVKSKTEADKFGPINLRISRQIFKEAN